MKHDPNAVKQLNRYAIKLGKDTKHMIRGYFDLCEGDAKMFIMEYSDI